MADLGTVVSKVTKITTSWIQDVNNFVYRNVQGWLLKNADNTGVTDTTTLIRTIFDACIPTGSEVILPGGTYLVSGQLSTSTVIPAGALNIRCVGDVTINVDAGAAAIDSLLTCYTTAINSSTISGGRLTLNLNGRAATGILTRHAGGNGGSVDWGQVTVLNAKKLAGDTNENGGLLVTGRYLAVTMRSVYVDTVERTAAGGACKGISISDVVGPVVLNSPQVARVLSPLPASDPAAADADGIAVFGRDPTGTVYATRDGSLTIISPVITDCQGRSIKTQISQSTIVGAVIKRQAVEAFDTADIDHQVGGVHELVAPSFEYRKNGGTSPVPTNWIPIGLQQQCTDQTGRIRVVGGTLRTESPVSYVCYLTVGSGSLGGEVELADFEVQCLGGLTSPISRAVLEFNAAQVQAAVGNTHITLRGNRGDFNAAALLGYTLAAANTSKLSFDLTDNENTGADTSSAKSFANLSGTAITTVGGFRLSDNAGFSDLLGTWVFNYLTLKAGCSFTYDRATSTATNAPVMTGAYPRVEALGSISSGNRDIRIMEDTGAALVVHFRQGGTWRSVV